MKMVFTGDESAGKSLQLARKLRELVLRNERWANITGIKRPIRSNMRLSEEFVEWAAQKNVPIFYWNNLSEIIYETECDIIIDELIKYFDSRAWADMSIDAKHFLSQGAKSGVHIYAAAQDFSQVDKAFRLLTKKCYVVSKFIGSPRPMKTAPPVKKIWGICFMREVNPKSFKGDTVTMETIGFFPTPFLIEKVDCEVFDTNAKIIPSELPPLKRMQRHWFLPDGKIGYTKTWYV